MEKAREPVVAGLLAGPNSTSRIPKLPRVGTLACFRGGGHARLRVQQKPRLSKTFVNLVVGHDKVL